MQEKGAAFEEAPNFGIMGSCELLGKIKEIRKDEDISSLQGWSKVLKSLRFWFWWFCLESLSQVTVHFPQILVSLLIFLFQVNISN